MNKKVLKDNNFLLLMMGKLVSMVGSNMLQFALSLYVLNLTGSATIFASMMSILIFPRLILSPLSGVFGDWFNRKYIIIIMDIIDSFIIGIFAIIFYKNNGLTVPMIYLLVILLEITEIFFGSAMSAVLPSIVEEQDLREANGVNSIVMSIGNIIAPLLGASLYGVFGLQIVLIINAVTFLLSAISEAFLKIPKNKRPDKLDISLFKKDFLAGIEIIKNNKFISIMIRLGMLINLVAASLFSVGIMYILKEVLVISDIALGISQTIMSISMIIGPLLSMKFLKEVEDGKILVNGFLIVAILIILLSPIVSSRVLSRFSTSLIPLIGILVLSMGIGMCTSITGISIGTIFNRLIPIDMMSRTMTVFNLAITIAIPIGQMLYGFMFDNLPASIPILISGIVVFLSTIYFRKELLDVDNQYNKEKSK